MSADTWPAEAGPAQGVYIHGLFLEGARWDAGQGCLAESHDGSSTASMPTIWLDPAVESAMSHQPEQHYRSGFLSLSRMRPPMSDLTLRVVNLAARGIRRRLGGVRTSMARTTSRSCCWREGSVSPSTGCCVAWPCCHSSMPDAIASKGAKSCRSDP